MSAESVSSSKYSQKEISAYLSDIEKKLTETDTVATHSLVALNQLLRLPNAADLFDGENKERAKDLWIKLKGRGIQLTEPPLIFGAPAISVDAEELSKDEEE